MNKFKYLKISKTKKIRYLSNYYKKNLYIVFLHGFMSDIEGEKPKAFLNMQKKINLGFLLLNTQVMENPQENLLMEILANGPKKLKLQLKNS